ncbi:MAG: serine/threonine-protein kinase [Planctomycetaceae bacterium]
MLNDRKSSELISRSLSGRLSPSVQRQVDEVLETSEQARAYAKLSAMIQESLSDVARMSRAGDESISPGLSPDSRERLKRSIRQESARLNSRALAATVTVDRVQDSTVPSADQTLTPESEAGRSTLAMDEQRSMKARFTLLKKLGRGGLGTVWLARDTKLNRAVALKEMNPESAEFPLAWDRFHREAEITGHLEHPNVVPLYQFGTDAVSGQPFYAMRFVGKRTLVDAIEEYHDRKSAGEDVTMDLHRLLSAFIGVCQAIAYAHSRGVIHRDLKPENVALDSFGQVIVLDWGLAKVINDHEIEGGISGDHPLADSGFSHTMAGEIIGTPLYMAPEQASGRLNDVDHRTDIYGLGAILFAMLTGRAPHQDSSASDGVAVTMTELLRQIAEGPSPRPADVVKSIPADLEAICAKAMQFKPHSRYQTTTEMSEAVQRWMAGRNERRQQYADSRSECRELRSTMLASVRDLERNVRFMSSLPPIQGMVNCRTERSTDDLATWREHLAVIYAGLLRTNCDFCSVSCAEVKDGQFQELLRIERQTSDVSNVRSIPASRLSSGPLTSCMQKALDGKPDEVHVALSSECPQPGSSTAERSNLLAAAVPVFDQVTEELFGFVMIEACLDNLIESQVRDRFRARGRLFVLDNECRILLQRDRNGSRVRENDGKPMNSLSRAWDDVLPVLKQHGEFIDEQDHAIYATRIDLVPGRYSLALALCLAERQTSN